MRILIDCDGPIFDWAGHLERAASKVRHKEEVRRLFTDVEEWRKIPEVDGARDAIRSLIADGHMVDFVSKPWESVNYGDWLHERERRLYEIVEEPGWEFIARGEDRAGLVGKYDLLIDDNPVNLDAWRAAGGAAFLFGTEYNLFGIDWPSIVEEVRRLTAKPAVVAETPAVATKGKRPPQIIVDALTARARDLLDAYEHGHDSQSLCSIITLLQHLVDQERANELRLY